jgi:hypothetical protein
MLEQAISDYLLWMISNGYANSTFIHYEQVLNHFLRFINQRAIPWDAVFTLDMLKDFQKESGLTHASTPVRGLSRYLFQQNRIPRPIKNRFKDYLKFMRNTCSIMKKPDRFTILISCVPETPSLFKKDCAKHQSAS